MSENRGPGLHRRAQRGDQGARACLRGDGRLLSRHPVLDPWCTTRSGRRRSSSARSGSGSTECRIWPKAEMWLEVVVARHRGGSRISPTPGVVRCDEVEKLPPDLDGFWILNPAGIVHLVCSPESDLEAEETAEDFDAELTDPSAVRRPLAATGAQAGQLDRRGIDLKARAADAARQRRRQLLVVELGGVAAGTTDEEVGLVRPGRRRAADIGVETVDPMDQTLAAEELQRPIDRRRCHAAAAVRRAGPGSGRRRSAQWLRQTSSSTWRAAPSDVRRARAHRSCAWLTAGVDAMADDRAARRRNGAGGFNGRHRRDLISPSVLRSSAAQENARAVWPGQ